MGFFSSTPRYSVDEHHFSSDEIKQLVWNHLTHLKPEHKTIVIEAIREKRGDDKEISLEQIYQVLLKLEHRQEIGSSEREEFMKLFADYFTEHFQ